MKNYYITTTLPYVNAEPHIGFGLEITKADVLARLHRLLGNDVIFNTGTDEHGQKIYQKALTNKQKPQEYCDYYASKFEDLKKILNLSYNKFIRTTDENHIKAAQEFWKRCKNNGDIYKKIYKVKYCVGCEMEKTDSELTKEGKCPLHPDREIELIEEENYFFKFSKYEKPLLAFYKKNKEFVYPKGKFEEIKAFVRNGLQDFSISRLKEKMPWGIPVPDDKDHVMYVWFDALVNYISTLGWSQDKKGSDFNKFWPGVQIAGKDNLRQQSAMWQAMLMSAGLSNSKEILINGFVNVDGQKMSKSIGNVISPRELVKKYGTDGTRYLLVSFSNWGEDSDVNFKKYTEKYNADLANGFGNLTARVFSMMKSVNLKNLNKTEDERISNLLSLKRELILNLFEKYDFYEALREIAELVKFIDKYINENKPWEDSCPNKEEILGNCLIIIKTVAVLYSIIIPESSKKVLEVLGEKDSKSLNIEKINFHEVKFKLKDKWKPLFKRI